MITVMTMKYYRLLALVGKRNGKMSGEVRRARHSSGREETSEKTEGYSFSTHVINTNCCSTLGYLRLYLTVEETKLKSSLWLQNNSHFYMRMRSEA